jgi:16S rRNA U516 pseudouridylate synthase RsuA-like enzyme
MTFEEMQLLMQSVVISQRETQSIVESNSRAVQAMLDAAATDRLRRDEEKAEYENRIRLLETNNEILVNTQRGVVALLESLDEDRPTILSKLNKIEQKTDSILSRLSRDSGN